jgi:hypothetical protein
VTTRSGNGCAWAEVGGVHIAGITNTFGGNSQKEFGALLVNDYPESPPGTVSTRYNDFRRILSTNPCPA